MWQSRRFRAMMMLVVFAALVGWLIKSQLPAGMSAWHQYSAKQYLAQGQLDEALEACNQAFTWRANAPELFQLRAEIQQERGEPQKALEDCNELLRLNPHYPRGYQMRATLYQLLGKHDKALEDVKELEEWLDKDHRAYNAVAYLRAVSSQDEKDLEVARQQIETAFKLLGFDPNEQLPEGDASLAAAEYLGMYLDTRGYILYRQGKHKEALADLDKAIVAIERVKQSIVGNPKAKPSDERMLNRELGVMHEHRGLAHEKLGDAQKAQADKDKARELGYDPKRDGV
jgi:tetratricopeptide (TPR) repeat protein